MKKVIFAIAVITGLSFTFTSCKLDDVSASSAISSSSDDAISDFTALATADTIRTKGGKGPGHGKGDDRGHGKGGDSIRVKLTEIEIATLPAAITSYISTNYAGATIKKAATNADKSKYFIGILKADATKAMLEFDGTGAFVNERSGKHKGTSIDISTLSSTITTYISTNYAGSTIQKAFKSPEGTLVVVKKSDGTFVGALFNADGTFNKEVSVKPKK